MTCNRVLVRQLFLRRRSAKGVDKRTSDMLHAYLYSLWRWGVEYLFKDVSHETPDVTPCCTSPPMPFFRTCLARNAWCNTMSHLTAAGWSSDFLPDSYASLAEDFSALSPSASPHRWPSWLFWPFYGFDDMQAVLRFAFRVLQFWRYMSR